MVEIDFQRSFQTFGFKPLVVGFAWFQLNWDNDPSPCNWPAGPMCGCFTEYIRVHIYIYTYIYIYVYIYNRGLEIGHGFQAPK